MEPPFSQYGVKRLAELSTTTKMIYDYFFLTIRNIGSFKKQVVN